MAKKSDNIIRKFIKTIFLKNWLVESLDENYQVVWNDIESIHKTAKYDEVIVELDNKQKIRCADDHIFIDRYGKEVFAKDSIFTHLKTKNGFSQVRKVRKTNKQKHMYDLSLKDSNSLYLTNNILSHNTTSYTVFCLWMMCFYPNKSIMLAANKAATAIDILDRVRIAYEFLPSWIKPAITTYNKSQITLSNYSRIYGFATSSSAIRGFSANFAILDEFAYVPKNVAQEFFQSVVPVLSTDPDSRIIVVSTANGTDNLYYEIWSQAIANKQKGILGGWQPFRMDWWDVPGRDEEWKAEQIATIGEDRFRVEFGNEFDSKITNRLLPDNIIEVQRKKIEKPFLLRIKTQHEIFTINIFHKFEMGKVYVSGLDIGEGILQDDSVCLILDITDISNIKLAASFSSNSLSVARFASLSARLLNAYNCPIILCESNGIGSGFISIMKDVYKYPFIAYFDEKRLGIQTTNKSKTEAVLWMRELLMANDIKFEIFDEELLNQLSHFSKKGTGYGAPAKLKDDYVLAFIWALMLIKPDLLKQYIEVLDIFISPELGVELPSKMVVNYEKTDLELFKTDELPRKLFHIESDIEADWFLIDGDNKITTTQVIEKCPLYFVGGGGIEESIEEQISEVIDFWNDDGPSW